MSWLLSPTNAIDDPKIGLYESSMYVIAGVAEHGGSVAAKGFLCQKKPVKVMVRDTRKGETCQSRERVTSCSPRVPASPRPKELAINRGNKYETRYGSTISESFAYQQGRHVQGPRRL